MGCGVCGCVTHRATMPVMVSPDADVTLCVSVSNGLVALRAGLLFRALQSSTARLSAR